MKGSSYGVRWPAAVWSELTATAESLGVSASDLIRIGTVRLLKEVRATGELEIRIDGGKGIGERVNDLAKRVAKLEGATT